MGIDEYSGTGGEVNVERGLLTSRKYIPGTSAGGLLNTDAIDMPMTREERFRESKVGQWIEKRRKKQTRG